MCNNNRSIPPLEPLPQKPFPFEPLPFIDPDEENRDLEPSDIRQGQIIGEFLISAKTGRKIKITK